MKLVTLTKLTLHTPEGDRSKFFADDFDAFSYKDALQTQQPITLQQYTALQSGDDHCLAMKIPDGRSNTNFSVKNTIYTATIKNGFVELVNAVITVGDGPHIYLSEDNQLYLLGSKGIEVETTRDEFRQVKAVYNEALARTRGAVTATQAPRQQPTLHQFWGTPSTQGTGWLQQAMQPTTTPASDPMDIESAEAGYDYFGVNK
jgi:hypothetical protein